MSASVFPFGDESPLRKELLSLEHLCLHAGGLSQELTVHPGARTAPEFNLRFAQNASFLKQAFAQICAGVRAGDPLTPDAEWLLDNFYVVEEQLREIRDDLPAGYFRELPKLANGVPRIYRLAVDLIAHTDSVLDHEAITAFVNHYQARQPLTIGEIWAVPIMLRLALVENLRRLAAQLVRNRDCRRRVRDCLEGWQVGESVPAALLPPGGDCDSVVHCLSIAPDLFPDDPDRAAALLRLLEHNFPEAQELTGEAHRRRAANQVTIGNVITSMRLISALDWTTFFEQTNLAERILQEDPAGVYPAMDLPTRDRYRHAIEDLAKHSGHTDLVIARRVVALAKDAEGPDYWRHVGYWLVDDGRTVLERELNYRVPLPQWPVRWLTTHPQLGYFGAIIAVMLIALGGLGTLIRTVGGSSVDIVLGLLLSVVPVSDVAVSLVNWLMTHIIPPRTLPKRNFQTGIPSEYRTIVVVPALLTSHREVELLLQRLEMHYVGNPDPQLRFALLTDFMDADAEHQPGDDDLVAKAVDGIRSLNRQYGTNGREPFYLLHRSRQWNDSEQVWMGWERKRGKLVEFNRLLHGDERTSFKVQEGVVSLLRGRADQPAFPFVITLDADTQLPLGTAQRLVATLAHPLNRPHLALDGRSVIHGYAVLQPRVSVRLADGQRTRFTQLFANGTGFDPYATAASDVYQDVFGEGSFTGKGIYDLRAFEQTTCDAFPENRILSHDLIEGCHARVGLVSDVELIDGYPARYDTAARRTHRWVRGDWQILPWILPSVPSATGPRPNQLSLLSRWKILDNVRRSLVAPATFLLLVLGWLLLPQLAVAWSLIAVVCLGFPAVSSLMSLLLSVGRVANWRTYFRNLWSDAGRSLAQIAVVAACLPHQAVLMVDAIARTLIRLGGTRRRLLEWETAAATERRLATSQWSAIRHLWFVPLVTVGIAAGLPRAALPAAAPWLLLWLISPLLAEWIGRPLRHRVRALSVEDQHWLRLIARKTWAFFEECVNERTNWLPPDNFQEYPSDKLAERISPTNEGLFLVSGLVARDFGFVGLRDLCGLWERNLAAWCRLPMLHGHFYNWYETATLQPLMPRYVSTVDSGNLAASLMVLQRGVDDLLTQPVVGPAVWQGLRDTVELALQACADLQPRGARIVSPPLDNLTAALESVKQRLASPPGIGTETAAFCRFLQTARKNLVAALGALIESHRHPTEGVMSRVQSLLHQLDAIHEDVTQLMPWLDALAEADRHPLLSPLVRDALTRSQSLVDLIALPDTLVKIAIDSAESPVDPLLLNAAGTGAQAARELQARFQAIAERAERLVDHMDFRFLYNPQRRLFSIGYNLEDGRLDRSYYDMLCSEARLSSHLAIAKGDVLPKHWFQLARQLTQTAGRTGLLSWGGTMFEFLMPVLFQRQYTGSLLSQACIAAVARQQEYGRQTGVPWGVSESAFAALAVNSDYHYQSFGVPGLGLKRGLSEDLVVAPYATMLALGVDAVAATENLRRLAHEGGLGRWGFYEAIDYTPERVPAGKKSLPVRCYMAHHLGMSLTALGNVLLGELTQRRFHSHPLVRATELLLQESMSTATPVIQPHADEIAEISPPRQDPQVVSRYLVGYQSPVPRTHLLSNGTYSVLLTNTGGGFSRWGDIGVTRWRADIVRDRGGQFLYLRDVSSNRLWSATYQPTGREPQSYEVTYSIDKAEYRRHDGDWETHLEVTVSSEDPAEVRQLTITNHSRHLRTIEVTSYAEVSLTTPAADLAHPTFQKLFVETEYVPEEFALLARRRPREPHQSPLWAVHVLSCATPLDGDVQYESCRQTFIGRGRDVDHPLALEPGTQLTGTTGRVLDPVLALRCRVQVAPHRSVTLAFTTGIAESHEAALRLADQFHEPRGAQRAFELAWAYSQVQLQHLHLTPARAQRFQQLASYLIFPQSTARGDEVALRNNRQSQSGLWRFGISGDWPILLVKISESDQVDFIREVFSAHEYWETHGLTMDVVVLNTHPGSYLDALQEQLQKTVQESPRKVQHARHAIFLLRGSQIAREDHWLLEAAAHVVIDGRRGWSSLKVTSPAPRTEKLLTALPFTTKPAGMTTRSPDRTLLAKPFRKSSTARSVPPPRDDHRLEDRLEFWNGLGGFADNGREYHLHLRPGVTTPAPWSNVIANPRFGCLVTESGGGYTWFENSRENKLTTWVNDPISDAPAELLFLRDEATQAVWRPLDSTAAEDDRWIHHGAGYTRFRSTRHGLTQETLIAIAQDDPVKFVCVKLTNTDVVEQQLSATYYAELVLGVSREQTQLHIVTDHDAANGALLARNPYHPEFPDQVAFLRTLTEFHSCTGDRLEFLGRQFGSHPPAGLLQPMLSNQTGAGLDPCAAVQCRLIVPPGETVEAIFILGCGASGVEAQQLLQRYATAAAVHRAIDAARAHWDSMLTAVQVETPNRAFNLLVNRWLLYQTLSCRLWGRAAYYQCGGAYGFRDQLQDAMALVYSRPDLVRAHLLRAAARQYEEGDVQHWWHPPLGRGTRTRFSDDLLFLPFATAHYVRVTGDESVLDEVIPFLHSPPLAAHEQERYEFPQVSPQTATLYDHCRRAIEHSSRTGEHGLPLMGCGDWNDGMNLVGAEGRGESVWVGWFLLVLIDEFTPVMERRGDHDDARRLRERGTQLRAALEHHAWDGEWYLRAFFDDGTPLGSHTNEECQIDSLAQSWAVLADADEQRTDRALESAWKRLVFPMDRLVALFQPPFDQSSLEPGYIKGYLPGVRENGGQYTHAVLWLIQAFTRKHAPERAMGLFDLINPILHSQTPAGVKRYKVEPYVVVADVYSTAPHQGRGGWTWYTGSASWTYRVALESILGFDRQADQVLWRPCVPADWDRFVVRIRQGATVWQFTIELSGESAENFDDEPIALGDDGLEHRLVIRRAAASAESRPASDERRPAVNGLEPHSVPVHRRTQIVAGESPEAFDHDGNATPAAR